MEEDKNKIRTERIKKVRRGKRIRGVKRVIKGVTSFLQKERRILDKNAIESILPHRGDKLLLDRVVITANKVSGEFVVTEEVCKGHEFNGQLIFRGIDTVEMAAQLLGIWAAQYSEFKGKLAYFRSIQGETRFVGKIVPSDLLVIEMPVREERLEESGIDENPRIEIRGRPGRLIQRVIGENFIVGVNKETKATISHIELIIIEPESLAE